MDNVSVRRDRVYSYREKLTVVVDVDVIEIPDIEYNGYCFSDGVQSDPEGSDFRWERSQKHWPNWLPMPLDMILYLTRNLTLIWQFAHVPSGFQFRLGGYKGVLAVDPEAEGRTGIHSQLYYFHLTINKS